MIHLQFPKIIQRNKLHWLILILLVMGVFFRVVNLDRKIAWGDEYLTSIRIYDYYTDTEIQHKIFNGKVITIKELHQTQRVNPRTNVIDVTKNKLIKSAEHPPLYYIMARLWAEWFGSSVAVLRSLAALISLFAFPCIYWLCWELFGSSLAAWLGVAIIAISPIHVLYAQEAREYSLWTVAILLSSAALLRALRVHTTLGWATYAGSLALGFYAHLFFILVAVAQGIYVVITEGIRLSKNLAAYLLASMAGIFAFFPWIFWAIINRFDHLENQRKGWSEPSRSWFTLFKRWVGNFSRIFIDFGLDSNTQLKDIIWLIPIIFVLLILAGYAIYFLCRQTQKRVWLFVLLLIGFPILPLVLHDVLVVLELTSGKFFSAHSRYIFPFYLGIQIGVVYLLSRKITSPMPIRQQKLWQLVLLVLVSSSILSCQLSFQSQVWWSKGEANHLSKIATIVNQASQPLLISDAGLFRVLSLSYLLEPKVRLQLLSGNNQPEVPNNFRNLFLFSPSKKLRKALEQEYKSKSLYKTELQLWQLETIEK